MEHSDCPSHCISYALSDPKNHLLSKEQRCAGGHQDTCVDCADIFTTMDEVVEIEKINPKNEDDLLYDVNIAKAGILKWLQHIRHAEKDNATISGKKE